jgi:hypothetical protein
MVVGVDRFPDTPGGPTSIQCDENWRVNNFPMGVYVQYYGDGNYNGYTH